MKRKVKKQRIPRLLKNFRDHLIRKADSAGYMNAEIALMFNISVQHIGEILNPKHE